MFRRQPGYCCVCGNRDEYAFEHSGFHRVAVVCSVECRKEFDLRAAMYSLGKEFSPDVSSGRTEA